MASCPCICVSKNTGVAQSQSHFGVHHPKDPYVLTAAVCTQTGFSEVLQAERAWEKDACSHVVHGQLYHFLISNMPEDDGAWSKEDQAGYSELLQQGCPSGPLGMDSFLHNFF